MKLNELAGLSLDTALKKLADAHLMASTKELRSKKGVDGGEARVLRATFLQDGSVLIVYAYFPTEILNKE